MRVRVRACARARVCPCARVPVRACARARVCVCVCVYCATGPLRHCATALLRVYSLLQHLVLDVRLELVLGHGLVVASVSEGEEDLVNLLVGGRVDEFVVNEDNGGVVIAAREDLGVIKGVSTMCVQCINSV